MDSNLKSTLILRFFAFFCKVELNVKFNYIKSQQTEFIESILRWKYEYGKNKIYKKMIFRHLFLKYELLQLHCPIHISFRNIKIDIKTSLR